MSIRFLTATSLAMLVSLAVLAPPASAQQKTAKACQKEWVAIKATQPSGKTEKAYIAECTGKGGKPSSAAATTEKVRGYDR
jgi:hypothetical protein